MPKDIETDIFLSLEKYYGKPRKTNKIKYKKRYNHECFISKYITNYFKSLERFGELYDRYKKD